MRLGAKWHLRLGVEVPCYTARDSPQVRRTHFCCFAAQLPHRLADYRGMEWWNYIDDDVEGGVLEFDLRVELLVYQLLAC